MAIVVIWQALSKRWELRRQFFIAFVASWIILGTASAIALSSGGPVYFGKLTAQPDPYHQLTLYLEAVHDQYNLHVIGLRDWLWQSYTLNDENPFTRISAMPSMHVAMVALFALVGWRTSRLLGVLFVAYAVVVLIGSVVLGWHYAIDGYASILGVGVIWWWSGRLARRWHGGYDTLGSAPGPASTP